MRERPASTSPRAFSSVPGEDGIMAVVTRLVEVLTRALPPDGPHAGRFEFLHDTAAGARSAMPAIQRFAAALGLAQVEMGLLVLAGLAEEHEAIAALLRSVHPRGEPRPTLGLAAQLFCHNSDERKLLRQVIERGPGSRTGTFKCVGDGPF